MKYLKLFESHNKELIESDVKECMYELTDDYDYEFKSFGVDQKIVIEFTFKIDRDKWLDFSQKLLVATDIVRDKLELETKFNPVIALKYDGELVNSITLNGHLFSKDVMGWVNTTTNLINTLDVNEENRAYKKLKISFYFELQNKLYL